MRDDWLDLIHGACCVGCHLPGRVLCPGCVLQLPLRSVPAAPDPCPEGLRPCRVAGDYDGLLQQLVLAHKERRTFGLATVLGSLLALAAAPLLEGGGVLVPVPTRRTMVRRRGHDPTLRVTRSAAAHLRRAGHDVRTLPLLAHRLPVLDQAGLDSGQRAANRADSLVLRSGQRAALVRSGTLPGIVICDDVLTTGATAREAQRALVEAGVPVTGIACVAATRRRVPARDASHPPRLPFSPPTY